MRLLDSYLELGVVGMARAAQAGWFDGHYGAALLAGYFMDREHELPEHVKDGIERTCEAFRREKPDWFLPLVKDEKADMCTAFFTTFALMIAHCSVYSGLGKMLFLERQGWLHGKKNVLK